MKHRASHKFAVLMVLSLAAAGVAFAQTGRGVGRLGGIVMDMEDKPLEGIKVILQFAQNEALKFEQVSNKKGEWSFIGLGSGAWNIIVAVPGYEPVNQAVQVSQLNVNPKATVRLKKSTASFGGGLIEDEASFEFLEKGGQLYKDGKYDEAIAAFQEFKTKNPKAYQVDLNIADCLREKGEYDQANELYNSVIAKAAADAALGKEMAAKALAGIGNIYLKQEKIAEAQEFFKKSIESSPKDEVLAYNVGEIYFSNQNQDEALKYFQLAASIKPDWPDPQMKIGYVLLNKGDTPNAVQAFEKFLTLEPEGERAALIKNILTAIKK
jgi:tetratricopeptide (TPR) repeat protein